MNVPAARFGANSLRNGPDARGRFGEFGGRFVAETLMPLILEVEAAYNAAKADPAAAQLLQTLRIDSEGAVRSNSAWSLGRLYPDLVEPRQQQVVESLLATLLQDGDPGVRDEARLALEQLEQPEVLDQLQTLVEEGLIT